MNRRRRFDKFVEPFVVETDDGKKFRCSVSALGREAEPRWVLLDSDGMQYIGPLVEADKSPAAVERLIDGWWNGRKSSRAEASSGSED